MLIKLSTGFFDGVDHFNFAEVGEITGKQQNYLVNHELVVNNIGHIPKILADLILSFQTEQGLVWKGNVKEDGIWKLPTGDIETILVKIRENTFGPKFYQESNCTHCGTNHKNIRTDLDKLEIKAVSTEDVLKPKVVMLPKAQVEVEFKPMFMRDLFTAIKFAQTKQDELVTSSLSLTIKRIGTKTDITPKDIESLSARDIFFLQREYEKVAGLMEGKIDTDITIECVKCKKDFTIKLNPFDPSFFFPSEESTN